MRSQRPRNSAEMRSANSWGVQLGGLGGALDLLAVLVGAGEEPGVNAQRPLAARNGVGDHRGVGVADVRARVDVIDGGGEVELVRHRRRISEKQAKDELKTTEERGNALFILKEAMGWSWAHVSRSSWRRRG